MNRIFLFAFVGLAVALLSPLRGVDIAETAEILADQIRAETGPGWQVSYHAGTGLLDVESVKAMHLWDAAPPSRPGSLSRPSAVAKFSFTLRIFPLVSPLEYAERSKRNEALHHKLTLLHGELRGRGVPYEDKGGEFRPRTEAEKRDVAEYRRLESSLEDLPDFFFRDISLAWISGGEDAALDVADAADQRECDAAIRKTLRLLSKYPGVAPLPRPPAR